MAKKKSTSKKTTKRKSTPRKRKAVSKKKRQTPRMTWQARESQRRLLESASQLTETSPQVFSKHVSDANSLGLLAKAENTDFDPEHLSQDETNALEAIIIEFGRPVLLIADDDIVEPEDALWKQRLAPEADSIQRNIQSVGRVEVDRVPTLSTSGQRFDQLIGTCFAVAPNLVLTNRHVAEAFCNRDGSIKAGRTARVDFVEEQGRDPDLELKVLRAVEIGDEDGFDYALLEVEGGAAFPPPLDLATSSAEIDIASEPLVYVIGYPAFDSRNPTDVQNRIFGNIFDVKRLAPGRLRELESSPLLGDHRLRGDYTSLGGNSGSAVIDLASGKVVGLHYAGVYGGANFSIPIWRLIERIRAASSVVNSGKLVSPTAKFPERSFGERSAPTQASPQVIDLLQRMLDVIGNLVSMPAPQLEGPPTGALEAIDVLGRLLQLIRARTGVTVTPDTPLSVPFPSRASLASFIFNHVNPEFHPARVHHNQLATDATVRDLANLIRSRS